MFVVQPLSPALAARPSTRDRRHTLRARLHDMLRTYWMRQSLYRLDDHILQDMGITRLEALQEARRPFWDTASIRACQGGARGA